MILAKCNFQAVVLSLPTIESTYVNHTTKGIQGFQDLDTPALAVALETLNAAEGYLWVRMVIESQERIILKMR